jgi:hypothetical protein
LIGSRGAVQVQLYDGLGRNLIGYKEDANLDFLAR